MEKRAKKIYRALAAGIIERDEVLLKLNFFVSTTVSCFSVPFTICTRYYDPFHLPYHLFQEDISNILLVIDSDNTAHWYSGLHWRIEWSLCSEPKW